MVCNRLRRPVAGLVALTVLTACLLASAQGQDKGKGDQEKFQGSWEVVSIEKGGEKLPDDLLAKLNVKFTFKGDKVILDFMGKEVEGTFKIDPAKKPPHIDLTIMDKTGAGIYAFDGRTLKICAGEPGDARPKEFKSEGTTNLIVLKRAGDKTKPAKKEPGEKKGARSDRELIQGSWAAVAGEKDGEKLPDELIKSMKFTVKGEKATVEIMGETKDATITLDPAKKPKTIDVEFDGQTIRGIYNFEKGGLRVCVNEPGQERPTEFKSTGGQFLLVFERQGAPKKEPGEKKEGKKEAGKADLDGTWMVESVVKGSEKLPAELTKTIKLIIKGDTFTLHLPGETKKGTFKTDPSKKPATIDLTADNETGLGIYELKGDLLKLCACEPGKDRPKEFNGDGDQVFVTLKRAKAEKKESEKKAPGKVKEAPPEEEEEELQAAAEQQPQEKKDQDRIQGTWVVQSLTDNGKAMPAEEARSIKLTFSDERVTIQLKDESKQGTFKLDPGKKPREIDITVARENKRGLGIYKFEDDTLTLAVVDSDRGRPKAFASEAGSQVALVVLKRAPVEKAKGAAARAQDEAERLREELKRTRLELEEVKRQLEEALARERAAREQEQQARRRAEAAARQALEEARRAEVAARAAAARAAQPADRQASHNNLRQIGLAMHNYHDTLKRFPAAAISSKDGKPLLSWRVAILPYIEQGALYRQFKLDEPWDSEHNKKLLEKMPKIYEPVGGAQTKEPHSTFYRVFTGPGTVFEGMRGVSLATITDGSANTALVVEASESVPWTKPDELVYEARKDLPKLGGLFRTGFHVLMADGSVLWVRRNFDAPTLRSVILRNDGMVIDLAKIKGE